MQFICPTREVLRGLSPTVRASSSWRPPLFLDESARIDALGRFVAEHAAVDFTHHAAWSETYRFIRWSDSDAAAADDGFAITQLFGPLSWVSRTFYRVALAPTTMQLLARFGYANQIARELGKLVSASPAMVAFTLPDEASTIEQQVVGGGAVMNFWLRATAAGLVVHPVSVVLQHPEIRHRLERQFGFEGRVFFLARLGYPSVTFPPAPRRHDPIAALRVL